MRSTWMSTAEKWSARGAVLDAFAVLLWLRGEVGADEVRQWLEGASAGALRLFISVINLGEVYYRLVRLGKKADADAFWRDLMRRGCPSPWCRPRPGECGKRPKSRDDTR